MTNTPANAIAMAPTVTLTNSSADQGLVVVFALKNDTDKPTVMDKTRCFFDHQVGNDLFDVLPQTPGFESEQPLRYLGVLVNVSNKDGANEVHLDCGESIERTVQLADEYDFDSWVKRGCTQFSVQYRAVFKRTDGKMQRTFSNTVSLNV